MAQICRSVHKLIQGLSDRVLVGGPRVKPLLIEDLLCGLFVGDPVGDRLLVDICEGKLRQIVKRQHIGLQLPLTGFVLLKDFQEWTVFGRRFITLTSLGRLLSQAIDCE